MAPFSLFRWLLVCSSLLVPSSSLAQTVEQPVAGYVMKRWTAADGLPQDTVSAVHQTRDGYLWVAVPNTGLVRFDGLTFTTFNRQNSPGLGADQSGRFFEDADGTLWIGTNAGLTRNRDGVFTTDSPWASGSRRACSLAGLVYRSW